MTLQLELQKKLKKLSDENYKKFSSALIPNVQNILGIRLPILKQLAKNILKNEKWQEYLMITPEFFEEKMLQGYLIGLCKNNADTKLKLIEKFVPTIDNWSICDSFCCTLKFTKTNKNIVWNLIQKYTKSKNEFEQRFAYVMMLNFFIEENYINSIFKILNKFTDSQYYAQMAVAWLISICYIKFPQKTHDFLLTTNLDKFTYNKSIQKIIESHQIDKKTKSKLKVLKKM